MFINNKCRSSGCVGKERGTWPQRVVRAEKIAREVTGHRKHQAELSRPHLVGVWTIDADRDNLGVNTTKLVVRVPELGHLICSPPGEVERIGHQGERGATREQ